MLEIKNLKKSYKDHLIFENFNLRIEQGEFVIISGMSGSGKTTLLNIIGSLEDFDSGKVRFNNIDISLRKNQQKYLGEKIAFIFQNYALLENKTVRENLNLIPKKYRTNTSIDQALEMVGMKDKIDSKVYTLSGGEQQRVAVARVIVKKCELILCDEPTGSLDKYNARKVIDLIKNLNQAGKTILLVSHDEKIKKIGDRIIKLWKILIK